MKVNHDQKCITHLLILIACWSIFQKTRIISKIIKMLKKVTHWFHENQIQNFTAHVSHKQNCVVLWCWCCYLLHIILKYQNKKYQILSIKCPYAAKRLVWNPFQEFINWCLKNSFFSWPLKTFLHRFYINVTFKCIHLRYFDLTSI